MVVGFFGTTTFCLWVLLCFVLGLFSVGCLVVAFLVCFTSLHGGMLGFFGCGCGVCWVSLVVVRVIVEE